MAPIPPEDTFDTATVKCKQWTLLMSTTNKTFKCCHLSVRIVQIEGDHTVSQRGLFRAYLHNAIQSIYSLRKKYIYPKNVILYTNYKKIIGSFNNGCNDDK